MESKVNNVSPDREYVSEEDIRKVVCKTPVDQMGKKIYSKFWWNIGKYLGHSNVYVKIFSTR